MKPSAFDYYAPSSLDEALELLDTYSDEGKALAGGQSLVPLMAFRLAVFGQLIDLNGVPELEGIREEGDELVIGAVTRHGAVGADEDVARLAPLLAEATGHIGHFQIRNRGTIGGAIAHADPAAEYPAVALTLDARLDVASASGRRTIPADELFDSAYVTTLAPEELITAIRVPTRTAGQGVAIREVARRHGDFALAGCAARVTMNGGVSDARVVLFGVAGRPVRLPDVEAALAGDGHATADLAEVLEAATADLEPIEDAVATSAYRRRVARHVARQAITDAVARAKDGA